MSTTTRRVWKLFWAWDDEREEAWLAQMVREGWHLLAVGVPGRYVFRQGPPRLDVYRLDFCTATQDYAGYVQLFADAGWTLVGKMGGWQYFRYEAADSAEEGDGQALPEIYTDNHSKAAKYRRVATVLAILLPTYSFLVITLRDEASTWQHVLAGMLLGFVLLCLYAIARLLLRIRELEARDRTYNWIPLVASPQPPARTSMPAAR